MKRVMPAVFACAACAVLYQAQIVAADNLPSPIVTANSVEICLNSRYSQHTLSKTTPSPQQLSNVLWAAGKAPVTGAYRRIYVATPTGTYLYDPLGHSLTWSSNAVTSEGAFSISYETERAFDAGVSYMPALLAAVSLGRSTESPVASCPKGTKLFFAVQAGAGLTSALAVHCSIAAGQPGWLPDPSTAGDNSLEKVIGSLNYVGSFAQTDLSPQRVSQILWAGYGCSSHTTTNGRAGLTVPSANATYYLTRSIYLVNESGVYRYLNRNPATSTTTRDHKLEQIDPASGGGGGGGGSGGGVVRSSDIRAVLQSAVSGLPAAPCYVILCLDSSYVGQHYAQLETGFVASNMLLQATAIGLGSHFKSALTSTQQASIRAAANIPPSHIPQVVVSIGPMAAVVSISAASQGDPGSALDGLTVRFFTPGADVLKDPPTYEFKLTAGKSVTGVAPGAYDITAFGDHTLTNVRRNVVVSVPNTSVDLGTLLEGNANQDDVVDLDDYAILSRSWLSSKSQADYDVRTDFDHNELINASDLSLLAANWLRTSPIEIPP